MTAFDHVWFLLAKPVGRDRKGQRCRVLARAVPRKGHVHSILVEFHDGLQVVTSRFAVRRAP